MEKKTRENKIIKASLVGIAGNLLLVAFKLIVGFASNSIAIILDGVNNATDALSSIVTIIGTKIANMRADREHPYGHGRIEYITAAIIATIILGAGCISLYESVLKIIHPNATNYTITTIVVIVVAILAKIAIGAYFAKMGKATKSDALIASGVDSNYDAVLSGGTLLVAIVQMAWNVNIDGIVGLIISLVVIKAGIDVLRDAVGPIIGQREDALAAKIIDYVNSFDEIDGSYDLMLDDFGPNEIMGCIHVEVPDSMDACRIHTLTRKISREIYKKFHVVMTIGIYAKNTSGKFADIREFVHSFEKERPEVLQTHGFFVDEDNGVVYFDLVVDFHADADSIKDEAVKAMQKAFPQYKCDVMIDADYEGASEDANRD